MVEAYACEEAESDTRALERVSQGGIDLIATDHQMPGLTGLELLEPCTKDHSLPTILLSRNITDPVKRRAYELGACAVLKKPCNVSELMVLNGVALNHP